MASTETTACWTGVAPLDNTYMPKKERRPSKKDVTAAVSMPPRKKVLSVELRAVLGVAWVGVSLPNEGS